MNLGPLSVSHEAVSKLYTLASCLKEDKTVSKEELLDDVLEVIEVMDELNQLLH
jgi:hypothetical protein